MIKKILLLAFFLANSGFASGPVKLADAIVSNTGIKKIVAQTGLKDEDARQVESYLTSSLKALMNSDKYTAQEVLEKISKMPATGEDAQLKKELQSLLNKSTSDLKKEDIVKTINHTIYISNRYGKAVVITCSDCVNDNIAKTGFKFSVQNIQNSSAKSLLDNVIPNNARDLNTFITQRSKKLGFGDYSRATPGVVLPEDEKTLALFLGMSEYGPQEFKQLSNVVKKLATKNSQTNLYSDSSGKFWRIAARDMSGSEIKAWTNAFEETLKTAQTEKLTNEEAFYAVLKRKASDNPAMFKKLQNAKAKRCFFK